MKKIALLLFALCGCLPAFAQIMMVNVGDTVRIEPGYVVSVHGGVWNRAAGMWYNSCDSVLVTDTVRNSGGNSMFKTQFPNGQNIRHGAVILNGDQQNIDGPDVITFQTLRLRGNGKKTMDNDEITQDTLDLWNRELDTRTHTMFVTSTAVEAVQRINGFVSSDSVAGNATPGGALSRATKQNAFYLFPVGDSLSVLRYRPIELRPATADSGTYTVRMANYLANYEGFPIEQHQDTICRVNNEFFWRINQTHGTDPTDVRAYYDPVADTIRTLLGHFEAPEWELMPNGQDTPGSPLGSITVNGWTDFHSDAFALVRPHPRVTIDPLIDSLFCADNGLVTITGATPPGGIYYVDNIPLPDSTFFPGQFGPGVHIVKYIFTDSVGCFNAAVDTFRILNTPFAAITVTQGSTHFCAGDSVQLTAAPFGPGYAVQWLVDGVPTGFTGETQTFYNSANITIVVTDLNTGCVDTVNAPIVITVQPNPVPTINLASTTVCSGDPAFGIPFVVTPTGSSGVFYFNGVLQATNVFFPNLYAQNGQPEIVTVWLVAGTNFTTPSNLTCTDTAVVQITVNPSPEADVVNLSGTTTACAGTGITLKALPDNMLYQWSNGETTQIITVTQSSILTLTVTDPTTGCKDIYPFPIVLTLHATPTATLGVFPAEVCNIEPPFPIPGTFDFGVSEYYLNGVKIPNNTFDPTDYALDGQPDTVKIWYTATLIYPDVPMQCADTSFGQIIVYPQPVAEIEIVSGTAEFCDRDSVILRAKPNGPNFTYLWSTGDTTETIVVKTAQTVTLTVTGLGGCADEADAPLQTVVNPLPQVILNVSPVKPIYCFGDAVTLSTIAIPNATYEWNRVTPGNVEVLSSGTNTVTVFDGGLYIVKVTDAKGCKNADSLDIPFNPAPEPVLTLVGTPDFCEGDSLLLIASPAGLNFIWSVDGIDLPETNDTIVVKTSGVYGLRAHDDICPDVIVEAGLPVNVIAYETPVADGGAEPDTTTVTVPIQFVNQSFGDTLNGDPIVTYSWDFGDGSNLSTQATPTHSYSEEGYFDAVLTVTTLHGCTAVDTVKIVIVPEGILVPDAFSPNIDGNNDEFVLYAPGITEFEMEIFSRWGLLVFKTNDVTNHWRGYDQSGKVVPEGVYVYSIKAKSRTGRIDIKKAGTVTVVR